MPAKRRKDNDKDSTQKHPNAMRGSGSEGMRGGAMRETSGMGGSAMSQGGRPGVGDDGPPNAMATRSGQGQRMQTGRAGGGSGGNEGPGGPVPPKRRSCGTMNVHRRLLSESAEYRAARAAIENATLQRVALAPEARFAGVARIPWSSTSCGTRPPRTSRDAQVDSQIDVLNRDFRATNPDIVHRAGGRSAGWSPTRGSSTSSRPWTRTGNPTNGITRTQTSTASFGYRRQGEVGGDRRRRPVARPTSTSTSGSASSAAACSATRSSRAARPTPTAWSSCTPGSAPPGRRPRRSTWAAPPPTRSATTSTCSTSGATTATAAAAATRSPTRPTRPARTSACRRSRT